MDRVRPHHDGILAVVRVVALAPADDLEAERLVHLHRVVVRGPHLERHPLGAHVVGGLDEAREEDPAITMVLEVAAYSDRHHSHITTHSPITYIADDWNT